MADADLISRKLLSYGSQKRLALDAGMTDVELSRLLNDQAPKLLKLFDLLELEVVPAGYINNLKAVLKESL